jgi:hypothetical protein
MNVRITLGLGVGVAWLELREVQGKQLDARHMGAYRTGVCQFESSNRRSRPAPSLSLLRSGRMAEK